MGSFTDLALTRRSIRKFEDKDIPWRDVEHFIKVATSAPSGCNSQCWRFVAIKDKSVMEKIKQIAIEKVDEILGVQKQDLSEEYLASRYKMVSFFSKAPVVIAVFMTKLEFYDPLFVSVLKGKGYDDGDIMQLLAYPNLLSIGAAVQNLLLAVHEKGYGACWMNEPAIAGKEINKILNIPETHQFISLVPIGFPAYTPREKRMKDFSEVFSVI